MDATELLQEKIALEHLWTEQYRQYGSYTPAMVPLTSRIKAVTLKLITKGS